MNKIRKFLSDTYKFFYYLKTYYKSGLIFEIHAAEHCNLHCKGCTHYSPIAEKEFCDLEVLEKSLKRLKDFQDICDHIHILGGEPLLSPQICDMMRLVRKYMDKTEIYILTNGILLLQPDKLPSDFWKTCRDNDIKIKVTQYPVSLDYKKIEDVCRDNDVDFHIHYNRGNEGVGWRETLLSEQGGGCMEYKLKFFKLMKCQRRCFQIVGDKIYPCTRPAYIRHLNKKFNTSFKVRKADYIEIDKLKSNFQLRKKFLFAIPFCNYCPPGTTQTEWAHSKCEKSEWVRENKAKS